MALNVSSLSFNGQNRYAKLSTNASLKNMTNFTWMAWVKVGSGSTSSQQRAYVERQGSGSGIRFGVVPYKGRLRFELSVKDGRADTNYDYKYNWDDRWHHIAFVARITGANPTYEVFIDAVSVAKGTLIKPSGVDNIENTTPLGSIYVGNHSLHTSGGENFPSDRYWDGKIDEILIFNQAKNGGDILAYMTSDDTWSMSDVDMFSYWRFDENTGSTTTDSDNAGWTGTLYQNGVASSALWTIDRPFLGNGTVDSSSPTVPSIVGTTNITSDGFTATWGASTDNVYVQGYELDVSTTSSFTSPTTYQMGTLLTKAVTGLVSNSPYYWRVRAIDAELNTSAYTATQSLNTAIGAADITPPLPPTSPNVSSLSWSSFTVNYTASASSDETGYKIDVGLDPNFNSYLSGFRNKDIGNVVTTVVSGTTPLTTYYIRLRAYDAAGNESANTATLVVQTPTQPDIMPPSVVNLNAPASIVSRAFTANWDEGEDNIGISYYVLDVSTDPAFGTFVQNASGSWQARNVGNVLSYRVDSLSPDTTYYYRVRAYDAAGNMSDNPTSGQVATTTPQSIEEGGFITTRLEPLADAWVNSSATTTNYGTDTILNVLGSGAANTRNVLLQFDMSGIVGAIQSATLNLYVSEASAATILVSADNVLFTESTVTWANQPSLAGSTIGFVPSNVGQWVAIDISSLLLDGATTYSVKLTTVSTDGASFHSKENTNIPYVELEYDPSTGTSMQSIEVSDDTTPLVNTILNPSFETNTTNWSAIGTGAVLSRVTTQSYDGIASGQVVLNGAAANQGLFHSPVNTAIPAAQGQTWTLVYWAKCLSGTLSWVNRLYGYTAASALVESSPAVAVTLTTTWQRFTVTYTLTNATTAAIVPMLYGNGTLSGTVFIDHVTLVKGSVAPAAFNGNTSGASWNGTANNSTSKINTAVLTAASTYIGDGDNDNSVDILFKRPSDTEWIKLDSSATTINRTTKIATSMIGPSYGPYNYVFNPSFEVDTSSWATLTSGGSVSMLRTDARADNGSYSLAVTTSSDAGNGVVANQVPSVAGDVWYASMRVFVPVGTHLRLAIRAMTSAGTSIGTTDIIEGVNTVLGADEWATISITYTAPATTAFVRPEVWTRTAAGGTFYVDSVQFGRGSNVNPYRDGTMDDAIWEGTAHASYTSLLIRPDTLYYVRHDYTDPDGIFENIGTTSGTISTEYTTSLTPDNVTTITDISTVSTASTIAVTSTYTGDDNGTMTARVEYTRTDLTAWTSVPAVVDRSLRRVTALIDNLKAGTSYTVRVTYVDADGVYGGTSGVVSATAWTTTTLSAIVGASRILFGGFVLFDGTNQTPHFGVVSHNAFGLPSRRVQVEDLSLTDGAVELMNVWGRRTITMDGFVSGTTPSELEDNLQALKRALAPRQQRLVIDTLGTSGHYYNATCEEFEIDQEGARNNTHLMWTATFVCADPFSYDAAITIMPETSFTNNATFTVNNLGDVRAPTYIKIRTNDLIDLGLTITNTTTGERITPQSTIRRNDRLVIDTNTYSVLKNGVKSLYAGTFIRLHAGANIFRVELSAPSGTPSILLEMQWQHKYL